MVDFESKLRYDVYDLKNLMSLLCSPDGCKWDREQTHESIKRNMLEEAYEAVDAIERDNKSDLLEELGDILMQIVFHADIANRSDGFSLNDIADTACKKLIRRHPHIFEDVKVNNCDDILANWDDIKRKEKHHETTSDAMQAVAKNLPALWRAEKIQKKAAKAGFDWQDYTGALDTLHAEMNELEEAISFADADALKNEDNNKSLTGVIDEIGDILFSVVNVARFFKIDPEDALNASSMKFTSRFKKMENLVIQKGMSLDEISFDEMDELYRKVKLGE